MIGPQLTAKINELRLKFREWLLSVSEQVPAVKRGPVAFLQQVQAERRDEAKKFLSSSAPETHQSIRFEEISLFEIIEQEQELRLHKRLNRLFTDQRARERLNEFFASDERIAPGPSWLNVGLISRDSAVVSLFSHCACDDLPTEVSRIGVTLERIIPSLVLLTFHAQLAQEVTYAIEKLRRTPCLPEIRFVPWWPFGKRRGYSRLMAQDTTVKTATRFRCDIRAKIEQCVRRLMNGRSTVSGRASVVQLPATEVFSIAEPSQTVDGAKWQLPASDWLVSFGIDLRRRKRETYRSSSELFIWQADSDHYACPTNTLLMTKAARERSGDFALRDLSLIVLAHYFEGLETTVAKATRRVYDSVRSVRPGRFRQDLELNRDVLHIAIFVERVSMQVEDVNNLIARNSSELEELKSDFRGDADATLGKHLQLAIPRHVRRIQRTSAATADAFARYLGLQNIRTTYNLQRGLFWLTIATIVIGGLTLYFTWRQGRHDVNVRTDAVQHSS